MDKITQGYEIEPVANGFILRPIGRGDCGRTLYAPNQLYVFETVDALAHFIINTFTSVG